VLPHAIAIGNIHIGATAGKLNAVMPATTPTGGKIEYESTLVGLYFAIIISMNAAATSTKPLDIYARVSQLKRDEKHDLSTDGQVAVCRGRLSDEGLQEGKVLIDPGRSAWNPNVRREAWDELMDRLRSGISGGFIVFDLERFTRQPKDGERMIDLAAHGLLVLDSESDYDLTTPNGKKAFRDAINAAAYYSDLLSTRSSRGKRLKAMSGKPNYSYRAFGFEDDRVTVRKDEAVVIREMTNRLLHGDTLVSMASDLNVRGILSTRGNPWDNVSLKQLLTRPINCGQITYKANPETGEKTVVSHLPGDPIVSEEDFDRVCAIFAERRRGRPARYLCSALAVCGACGFPLYGRAQKSMKPYPDGSVRRHYWCVPSVGGCGKTSIDQRALDKAVGTLAVEILADLRNTEAIETAARELSTKTARLDLEIAEAEKVAEALADRLGRGELTLTRHDAAVKPLDQRLAKLRAEREALYPRDSGSESEIPAQATREQWERRWKDADDKERRNLLTMGLRGRHLIIAPMKRGAGGINQAEVTRRLKIK
jgi:DNA invertase Pin-like site-specific DNA recombinase